MDINIFKVEDQPTAQKEIDCIMESSVLLEIHLDKGNFNQAIILTQDMSKSVVTLQKLIKEKETQMQLKSIVSKLQSSGIESSIVTRYFDNKKAERLCKVFST